MDNEAVSSIISAVLVLTLFTAAFGVWTVETLPEWIGEREHAHANDISDAMGGAMSDILAASNAGRGSQVSLYLGLAPEKIPLVQSAQASGKLEVIDGFGYAFNAPPHQLIMSGGTMATSAISDTQLSNVDSLLALQWEMAGTRHIRAYNPDAGEYVAASAGACSAGSRDIKIYIDSNTVVRTVYVPCFDDSDTVDLLGESTPFGAFLHTLEKPFKVSEWTEMPGDPGNAQDAKLAAAWVAADGLTYTTAGTPAGAWNETQLALNSIQYSPSYRSLDDRIILMEGGAVIHQQDDKAAMATPPSLVIGSAGAQGSLRWTMVTFEGEGNVGGSSSAKATYAIKSTSDRILRIPTGGAGTSMTLTSAAPDAWAGGWLDAAALTGTIVDPDPATCNDATGIICVTNTASTATLTLKSSIAWTIHLTIVHVDVSVT